MRDYIGTRQTQLRLRGDEANQAWIRRQLVLKGHKPISDWMATGEVVARIEYGNWIIDCPAGCGNAEFADPDWAYFACTECGAGVLNVTFPKDRGGIEQALTKRPLDKNRHWFPHETLKDLLAENKERL